MFRRVITLITLALVGVLLAGPPTSGATSAGTPTAAGGYVFVKEWVYGTSTEGVHGMGVSPGGEVFVVGNRVNQYQSKVRRYDSDGTLTHTWELPFNNPGDLTVDAAGNVHISDYFGQVHSDRPSSVHVYTRDGALVRTYRRHPQWGDSTLGAIAVDSAGNSYVTDPVRDVVYKFSPDGTPLLDFGGSGVAPGQFDSPWGIEVGADGNIYATDSQNHRVQVFTPDGAFVRMWGQSGMGDGEIFNPGDIATTPGGNLAVLDHTSRVQEFRPDGTYVRDLGDDHLRDNGAIDFDTRGAMYVAGYLASLTRGVAKYTPAPRPGRKPGPGTIRTGTKPLTVKKSTVRLTVACPRKASSPCRGRARIKVGKRAITKTVSYRIAAGRKKVVRLKVTRKGMRQIKRKPTRAVAELLKPGARKPSVRKKIRLRR